MGPARSARQNFATTEHHAGVGSPSSGVCLSLVLIGRFVQSTGRRSTRTHNRSKPRRVLGRRFSIAKAVVRPDLEESEPA